MDEYELKLIGATNPVCATGDWIFRLHEPVKPPEHQWEPEVEGDDFLWSDSIIVKAASRLTGLAFCNVCGIRAKLPTKIFRAPPGSTEEWDE